MEGINTGVVPSPAAAAEPARSSTSEVPFPPVRPPHSLVVDKGTSKQAHAKSKGCFTCKHTQFKYYVIYLNGMMYIFG